ncbi:MAG: hypothetical protein AAGA67_05775 [Cyanobacteria bacterium P01_F01_bin.153]
MKYVFWFLAIAVIDNFTGVVSIPSGLPAPPLQMLNLGQPPLTTPCPHQPTDIQQI